MAILSRATVALAIYLAAVAPINAATMIELRVVDGDGASYPTGSRATRGLTILVTDPAGKPVEGASVTFRLPDNGPGGSFAGGLRNQLVTTQTDGKASVWGMQWNKTPGPFEIRITATKDQARAGLVSTQSLIDSIAQPHAGGAGVFQPSHHSRSKWLLIGAAVAGAAAAGLFVVEKGAKTAAVPAVVQTQIGTPVITIGPP